MAIVPINSLWTTEPGLPNSCTLCATKTDTEFIADLRKQKDPRYKLLALTLASGSSRSKAVEETGFSIAWINMLVRVPAFMSWVEELQDHYFGNAVVEKFKRLLPDAIEVMAQILRDESEKGQTRLNAANAIADRALGKPKQEIAVQNDLLTEFMDRLNSQKIYPNSGLVKDVDPIDNFVDTNIPSFKVGTRDAREGSEAESLQLEQTDSQA